MNVQVNDSKVCVCVFLMFVTLMCVFVSFESVEWVAFVDDSIKIEGAEKKIFAEGHGCLCFLWYGERPQIVILWVGWLAGEVEMARYWWEALFGCVLVIDLLQFDRGLDLAEQTNWILKSCVFIVAWINFFYRWHLSASYFLLLRFL